MPTEAELRAALRDTASGAHTPNAPALDSDEVIRRARGRRRPRQLAFGAVATLAVAGFAYIGVTAIPWPQSALMSASDAGGANAGPELASPEAPPDAMGASAEPVNRCGQPLTEIGATTTKLVLTSDFPTTGASNGLPVEGTVTLTNTGTERFTGIATGEPTVVLSRDGIIVWHTPAVAHVPADLIDLAPGESKEFTAGLTPALCSQEDEDLLPIQGALPPLRPGTYQVTAYLGVQLLGAREADDRVELLGGPAGDLTILGE